MSAAVRVCGYLTAAVLSVSCAATPAERNGDKRLIAECIERGGIPSFTSTSGGAVGIYLGCTERAG